MKAQIITLISITLFLFSCSNNSSEKTSDTQSNDTITPAVLKDFSYLEKIDEVSAIKVFVTEAEHTATKKIEFSKDNINDVIDAAKQHTCIIVVGDHTIVKIVSTEDCQQSGSWGACMPKGIGYVKKGELEKKEDYINNIINRPDEQKRVAYIFE